MGAEKTSYFGGEKIKNCWHKFEYSIEILGNRCYRCGMTECQYFHLHYYNKDSLQPLRESESNLSERLKKREREIMEKLK